MVIKKKLSLGLGFLFFIIFILAIILQAINLIENKHFGENKDKNRAET